ncbi:MAG: hypothetical protein O7G86_19980 [Gammaproteobacteria bacterium]|nr:hypothetical protein [Gammaproteobacteria bacterium]
MTIEELKKEYQSVRAPSTAMTEAVGRFEFHHTQGRRGGIPLPAWSLVALIVFGIVMVPKMMEQASEAAQLGTELSLTELTMPVGPAMPSMTSVSTPSGAAFVVPQNQTSFSPALLPTLSLKMETI